MMLKPIGFLKKASAGGGFSAPTLIGTVMSSSVGTSLTIHTPHNEDDFILAACFNESSGSALSATPPTNWSTAAHDDSISQSAEAAAYYIIDSAATHELSSVTITSGRMGGTIVYRPDTGGTISIGATATLAGTSTSPSVPGLTLDVTDGSSVVIAGCLHESDTGALTWGGATVSVHTASGKSAYLLNYGAVSSFSQVDETSSGSEQWVSFSVELKTT